MRNHALIRPRSRGFQRVVCDVAGGGAQRSPARTKSEKCGGNCQPPNQPSPLSRRLLLHSGVEEGSQVGLKRLFSRRLSVRGEPIFEVPDPNPVLDLGLLDGNCNRRILVDRVDPIVLAQNVESPTYSFVKTARRHFDGMFRAVRVATRHFASAKTHMISLAFRFSFAKSLTRLRERE